MNCPVCQYENSPSFEKDGVDYHLCRVCDTCYCVALPNDNLIGGEAYEERRADNEERVRRFRLYGCNSLLDFGCGHGYLVEDARSLGVDAHGYDLYNPNYQIIPGIKFDVVSMVEVIEHTAFPFPELGLIWDVLKPKGHVYIETSFTDIARSLGDVQDFFYISPRHGHNTIFSHKSLDMLMVSRGFEPCIHINSTVRIYRK